MEAYFTIVLVLILFTVLAISAYVIFIALKRDYQQAYKKEEKKKRVELMRVEPMCDKEKARIIDNAIRADIQRKEKEERIKKEKEQKTKEILKQPTVLNGLILKVWQEKINSEYLPEIIILGKNRDEKVTITAYAAYDKEKKESPEKVSLFLENLPGFKSYCYKDFNE